MSPPAAGPRLLLVEDDETIGRHLSNGLNAHAYQVNWVRTGRSALDAARGQHVDVVLLDLGLPDIDGTDVARDLRHEQPDLLIVVLTARGDDIDVMVGLELGADDYLVKPVGLGVLLARLNAHLRRVEPRAGDDRRPLTTGSLTLDRTGRRCLLAGAEVTLRPKEFDVLVQLAAEPGVAVRREDLMARVWDEHWFGSTKTLDVTMSSLRQRLDDAAAAAGLPTAQTPRITTLRGHGYRLERPDTSTA